MLKEWKAVNSILCIRPDNMGDLLMSSPALNALKKSFRCGITVLTSSMGEKIARYIPSIDETIVYNVPWVKSSTYDAALTFQQTINSIKEKKFDAAVVFNVFSQNPLPSVMLAYLSGIPKRLAYCRENPYDLLTNWVPDKEPYAVIRHQVVRDLDLVHTVGATIKDSSLTLNIPNNAYSKIKEKVKIGGIDLNEPWIIVHPGASEAKRMYPMDRFKSLLEKVTHQLKLRVLITGSPEEKPLAQKLAEGLGNLAIPVAGLFSLEEFMALVDIAPLVLSVNTSAVHIAAALNTPVIVLYALTNPQHAPWNVTHRLFPFPVPDELKSKNEVLQYVQNNVMEKCEQMPDEDEVIASIRHHLRTGRLQHLPQD